MPYAVELFFDAKADAVIRGIRSSIPAADSRRPPPGDSRPHVSLLVADDVDLPAAKSILDRFAGGTPGFPLALSAIGLFAGPTPVLFLAPKVTAELLALQARFCADFGPAARRPWPYYAPAVWVPHCTLAEGVVPDPLAEVWRIHLPITALVSAVGLVEFSRDLIRQVHVAALR